MNFIDMSRKVHFLLLLLPHRKWNEWTISLPRSSLWGHSFILKVQPSLELSFQNKKSTNFKQKTQLSRIGRDYSVPKISNLEKILNAFRCFARCRLTTFWIKLCRKSLNDKSTLKLRYDTIFLHFTKFFKKTVNDKAQENARKN